MPKHADLEAKAKAALAAKRPRLGDGSQLRAMIDNANTDAVERRLADAVDGADKSSAQIAKAANDQSMAEAFEYLDGNTPRALQWAKDGDSRGIRIINQNMRGAKAKRERWLENPNNPLDEVLARWSDDLPDADKVRLAEEAQTARETPAPDATPPNAGPPGPEYPHVVRHESGEEWGFKTREEAEAFAGEGAGQPPRDSVDVAVDKIVDDIIEYDGFDAVKNLVHSPDYLPRRFSVDGIQNYRKTRTDEEIIQTIGAAIARANPERFGDDAGKAMTAARHYWETILDVYIRQDDGPRFAKKTFQDRQAALEEVREILKKQGKNPDDIAEEAMELLLEQLAPLQRAVSESNRAKQRMKLDLNSQWAKGLDEIFEQDALDLALDYSRTMAGYAALNRVGFNSVAELNKMISQAAKELDKGVDIKSTADLLDELRFWRDSILGQPSEELAKNPKTSWLASQARRVNFAAYMSNVAFAAVSEIAGHAMRVGVFNYMGQFSRYRGYMKRARKGDLTMADDVFATADIVMGHGTGMLRAELAQRTQRYDFDFPETDPGFNRGRDAANAVDTFTRKSANAVSRLSAMAPLQQFMRMTYVSAMADHLVKKAAKGGLPFSKRRLETMGITPDMWDRIAVELNNSGKIISPDTGREVPMIRHQEWKDREAADAFVNWLDRDSRRMILEGDIGHSPRFLREKPLVSLMFQFLSFPINAWTKHSGYLGNVKDGRAFAEMLVMATGGMIGVQARTFLQGVAIEDDERRAKFFEERLNPLELAKSSFYYSAHASLLPNIYDTAIGTARSFVGEEVLPNELSFSYTRNSGLASSFLTGNPTVATIDRAAKVLPSFFDEDGATKQDVQKAMKLLPFGNHVASIAVSEWLLSALPEEDVN
jgi:DNA-binding transcriptional MerR regulator